MVAAQLLFGGLAYSTMEEITRVKNTILVTIDLENGSGTSPNDGFYSAVGRKVTIMWLHKHQSSCRCSLS